MKEKAVKLKLSQVVCDLTPEIRINNPMLMHLANSLYVNGQQNPIVVRKHPKHDGYYQVVIGVQRVKASTLNAWHPHRTGLGDNATIDATIRDLTHEQALRLAGGFND